MNSLPLIFFITCFLLLLTYFIQISSIIQCLRENHPELYQTLGSPALIRNNTPQSSWRLLRFVFRNSPPTADAALLQKCARARFIGFVYLGCLMTTVILASLGL